jgi:hypothetical protein
MPKLSRRRVAPELEPTGFVVTLADAAPQVAAGPDTAARGGTRPPVADEDTPTVRLPCWDFAHAPTVQMVGWSPPR